MDAAVASFLDKIPGMSFIPDQDNIAYLKYMSETAQAARADLDAFTQELLTTGLPSDQIAKMAGQITRQAQEAADIVAAAASGNKVSGFDNGAEQEAASKAFTDTVAANDALIQEHMRLTDNLVSLDHYRYEQKRIAIDQQIADAQARGGSELDLIEQLNVQKELLHKNHLAKLKKDEDKAAEAKKKQGIANAKHGLNQMTESLAAVSQHSKDAFHAWKITATAKAIVDTYTAATGAYAAMAGITGVGPALGAAAAAAAVAAGLANVQAIKNTQYGSSSASASTPSGVSASSVSVPANGPSGPTDYSPPSAGERTGAPLVSITIAGDVVSDSAEWFAEKMTEVVERRLISAEIRGAA
jgi:hypothetical protein